MHKLADVLAGKDSETIFAFFMALVTGHLMSEARQAAHSGDIGRADRFARLSSSVTERITVAQAYNLDRKQTVLSILGRSQGSVPRHGLDVHSASMRRASAVEPGQLF